MFEKFNPQLAHSLSESVNGWVMSIQKVVTDHAAVNLFLLRQIGIILSYWNLDAGGYDQKAKEQDWNVH